MLYKIYEQNIKLMRIKYKNSIYVYINTIYFHMYMKLIIIYNVYTSYIYCIKSYLYTLHKINNAPKHI